MNHVPSFADFLSLAAWLFFGGWGLRALLCWFLRTREIERRMHELEALMRALGAHMQVTLPKPIERISLRARAMAWLTRLRA